jgi:hypothetical protein
MSFTGFQPGENDSDIWFRFVEWSVLTPLTLLPLLRYPKTPQHGVAKNRRPRETPGT